MSSNIVTSTAFLDLFLHWLGCRRCFCADPKLIALQKPTFVLVLVIGEHDAKSYTLGLAYACSSICVGHGGLWLALIRVQSWSTSLTSGTFTLNVGRKLGSDEVVLPIACLASSCTSSPCHTPIKVKYLSELIFHSLVWNCSHRGSSPTRVTPCPLFQVLLLSCCGQETHQATPSAIIVILRMSSHNCPCHHWWVRDVDIGSTSAPTVIRFRLLQFFRIKS